MESARCPLPPKAISPTTSKGEKKPAHSNNETLTLKPPVEIAEITSAPRVSAETANVENLVPPKEEIPQQVASGEQVKKKKKKPRMPGTDMQWNPMGSEYMIPMGPGPYFNGVQPGFNGGFHNGFNGFTGPFAGPAMMPPYVGYGPMDMSFMHAQGFGFPNIPPPHRDLAEMGNHMMMNLQRPPVMGREEFEAKKAEMKRKRENERRVNVFGDGDNKRINSSSPMKPKSRQAPISDYDRRRRSPERSERHRERDLDSGHDRHRDHRHERHREADRKQHRKRSEKQPSLEEEEAIAATTKSENDNNHKSSVFNRISFLAEEESSGGKQRKTSRTSPAPEISVSSVRRHSRRETDYDSSDDEDRHFKRKPSRYKRSPSVATVSDAGDENFRHSKRSKGERSRA